MLGCDFHCGYCQNWVTSQTLRDPEANAGVNVIQEVEPEDLVRYARRLGAAFMVSSYNEPLITSEWAVAIFKKALQAGLKCAYVSNGNSTPEVLRYLQPYLSAYKVDLKTMQDRQYRKLGGVLNHVLDTIHNAHDMGLWVEVVTLVIPGFDDSSAELWDTARYLASVSVDIPWHVTAFHADYKVDATNTPSDTLRRAAEIGQEAGLRYVYAGNLPGQVGTYEDTFCPGCGKRLIQRRGYTILDYQITAEGKCPACGASIAGLWTGNPETVRLSGPGFPRGVRLA
ncbi:MAG: radical SAM protein, partial [Anaerolineaceae bacterium]|nr:radical SAM protein [Anaerolineaceae bacterium]